MSPPVARSDFASADYAGLRALIRGQSLPAAFVDLDRLEFNARALLVRAGSLPIRIGSKSVRCVAVLRAVQRLSPRFSGLLCYSAREAAWLAGQGFDDLVVAYPTLEAADLLAVADTLRRGQRVTLMVDEPSHIAPLAAAAERLEVQFRLALDVDMSSSFPGVYFGMRRSPLHAPDSAVRLARQIAESGTRLKLVGIMGYEGQIAGLQDDVPGQRGRSGVVRLLKRLSIRELTARRQAVVAALRDAGFALEFVNGGGTGSLESTAADSSVTEVAAGSGLYSPALFDHFRAFRHEPSAFFALQAVRRPMEDVVTCLGGGYIASGPAGADRLPRPWLPSGLALLPQEGAGEVQTPVQGEACREIELGDPVFFRHAKAGELAERFKTFLLIRGGAVVDEVATYRGDGQSFL